MGQYTNRLGFDDWMGVEEMKAQRQARSSPSMLTQRDEGQEVVEQHLAKHCGGNNSGVARCQVTGEIFTYVNYDCVPTLSPKAYAAKVRRDHNLEGNLVRKVTEEVQSEIPQYDSSDSHPLAWIVYVSVPILTYYVFDYFMFLKSHSISDTFEYIQHCIRSCF